MGLLKINGNPIEFRDGMIAGITLANGLAKIVTHNTRHFNRIPDLEIIDIN